MGELTANAFADWLHPSDVTNHFYQQGLGDDETRNRATAMLCDGLLRAAAAQLIVDGRDLGLALIPLDVWPIAARSEVWTTSRFRFSGFRADGRKWSISAYDVRVDRDYQSLPVDRASIPPVAPPPLEPSGRRPGRRSGTNGEPIARVVRRLLALPEGELATYKVEAVASDLVEAYRALNLPAPHLDNARRDASGILRALRD